MAAKRRSQRITRPVKKRPAKKRVSSAAARARGARKVTIGASGMVETALAAFAHEVRTPLTGILAISNLLATPESTSGEAAPVIELPPIPPVELRAPLSGEARQALRKALDKHHQELMQQHQRHARGTAPEPTSLSPCWVHVEPLRVNAQAAPAEPLSANPPISAVLPSADRATE